MSRTRTVVVLSMTGALLSGAAAVAATPAPVVTPAGARHQPRFMHAFGSARQADSPLTPPAPPCPVPATVSVGVALPATPLTNTLALSQSEGPCVSYPGLPPAGQPNMGNMAYWGGPVQVHPRVYLVYLAWGRKGAFKARCHPVALIEGKIKATLRCDPDGAGKRMADFVYQLGGTKWAGVQSQYYQTVKGTKTYISNDKDQLGGIWVDDRTPTWTKLSYRDMAVEADQARQHFRIKDKDLYDSNVVIIQPQNFSDPLAASSGYCAWHDNIQPDVLPSEFEGLKAGLPFTNMPYTLNQGYGCGENMINPGKAGVLDSFTVALGHEIEETVTDPGAEDHVGSHAIGGWYDPLNNFENGDKCAYVGNDPTGLYSFLKGGANTLPVPGAGSNIVGNHGGRFPVQSLWSNNAARGVGYCAGAGTDLPL